MVRKIFTVGLIFFFCLAVTSVFAGGKKEKKAEPEKPAEKEQPAPEPETKEAKEMAGMAKETEFEGVAEVDYSPWKIGTYGGTFTLAQTNDPKTFNEITSVDTATSEVVRRAFEPVITRDILSLEWIPALAESWAVAPDELSVTFKNASRRGVDRW